MKYEMEYFMIIVILLIWINNWGKNRKSKLLIIKKHFLFVKNAVIMIKIIAEKRKNLENTKKKTMNFLIF